MGIICGICDCESITLQTRICRKESHINNITTMANMKVQVVVLVVLLLCALWIDNTEAMKTKGGMKAMKAMKHPGKGHGKGMGPGHKNNKNKAFKHHPGKGHPEHPSADKAEKEDTA